MGCHFLLQGNHPDQGIQLWSPAMQEEPGGIQSMGLQSQTGLSDFTFTFPSGSAGKESACDVGDLGSIPGLRRSPGEGYDYAREYCGLKNSMDCIVLGVSKSQT